MKKELIIGAILALFAAFFGAIGTIAYDNLKDNDKAKASATILYNDMEQAMGGMTLIQENNEKNGTQSVWNNPHIYLYGKHGELLLDLEDKISDQDIRNILFFYDMLNLVENARKDYYALKGEDSQEEEDTQVYEAKQIFYYSAYYTKMTNLITYYNENKDGLKDSIEKIKKISSFSNE